MSPDVLVTYVPDRSALQCRTCAATGMPQRKNCNLVATNSVVKPIMNAGQKDALHASRSGIEGWSADARLCCKKRKRFRQLHRRRLGRRGDSVPTTKRLVDLSIGPPRDTKAHRLCAAPTQPFEYFFG